MTEIGKVSILHKEQAWVVEWNIPDLESPSIEDDQWHFSPDFSFEGETWYLRIRMTGKGNKDSIGHIDLSARRRRFCTRQSIYVQFSISLKTANGQKDLEKQKTEILEGFRPHLIEQFMSMSEYMKRKSEFLVSGFLTIVCTFKQFSLAESVEQLRKKSEDTQLMLKKEIDDIRKELNACKIEKDIPFKEKLDEADIKATRENLGETNASLSCVIPHKSKILNDFKQLFLSQDNSDVVLRVKGQEFSAHKAILMARSPVFSSAFRNNMKEKDSGIIDIEDCDPSSFSEFLCFLYCEDLEGLSGENVFSLFTAADKYDVTDLRIKCLEFMKENMSVDTFCETITIALQHSETELFHSSTDFFIQNAEEILESVKWQTFVVKNPTQSNELFIKYVKSMKHLK